MRLKDKVAIVTGSTSGIGRATVEVFVREGARVLVTGRNREEGALAQVHLRAAAQAQGAGDALFVAADLTAAAGAAEVVAAAVNRWGRIDVLVNNAAMMSHELVEALSDADWDRVMAVNLRSPFILARQCLAHMGEGAAIVNISSVHAVETMPGLAPYAASKGGLESLTRALAVELHDRKIRVNAARLGAVDTRMLWNNPNVASGLEQVDRTQVGTPEQVAEAILFLASEQSAFTTGAILNVDGGRLAVL
ncbi:MAG: SDR family NAD(P)-dependent oxidoreductase [Pseudomonadota bacterium]